MNDKAPLNDNSPGRLFDRVSGAQNHDYSNTIFNQTQSENEYFSLRVKNPPFVPSAADGCPAMILEGVW